MPLTLAEKLRIRDGMQLLVIHPPADFTRSLGKLPPGVKISATTKKADQIHWFVQNKAELNKNLPGIMKMLQPETICWIYYPKGSSSIQTDLTRDKGWESLEKQKNLQWLTLISFDETWSSFGVRLKGGPEKTKPSQPEERIIFQYVDPKTKTVSLPQDLATAMQKDKQAQSFFNSLSFTNKKEYIEWVVTAKREETRKERIRGTMERLAKGWKNPRNL